MRLNNGDRFPELTVDLVEGGTLELPAGVDPGWAVVLFYRGHW
ncbi:MAG: hypothetical protein PVG07_16615 [Acidobacteriota bacterium]